MFEGCVPMIYQKHHAGTCLNFFTVQCIVVHSPVYIQCMSSVHTVCTIQCTVYSGAQSSAHLGHSWCIAETQLATSGIQPKCTSGTHLDTSGHTAGTQLDHSWTHLKYSWTHLAHSWTHLEHSWTTAGTHLAHSWIQLEHSWTYLAHSPNAHLEHSWTHLVHSSNAHLV